MSRRSPLVIDLGPIYLQVGGHDPMNINYLSVALRSDVEKLEALLDGSEKQGKSKSADIHEEYVSLPIKQVTNNEMCLLEALSQELINISVEVSEHVSLDLQGKAFEGIKLVVFERNGRLQFDLHLKNQKDNDWLSSQLQDLVKEVGSRLNRSIRIQLISTHKDDALVGRADWNK
jgi:hypothetical protein